MALSSLAPPRTAALALAALVAAAASGCASAGPVDPGARARVALDDREAAWSRMARPAPDLPAWARALAETLPATTALMLDLDHLHRARSPLGPMLAAKVRWTVADANRCAYGREVAAADLRKAGMEADPAVALAALESLRPVERAALRFARRLTLEAHAITDDEVAAVIEALGPDDTVAVVHAVCHGNFQDRILLALGIGSEPGGAKPPVRMAMPADAGLPVPPREAPPAEGAAAAGAPGDPAPWSTLGDAEIRGRLEAQKDRVSRIPYPDGVRLARLPRPARGRAPRVAWGASVMGYQPEMTRAWFETMESFDREAGMDQVLHSSVFWVVTRTSECFY
jgi:alkylhydroperoxidase family enzyme